LLVKIDEKWFKNNKQSEQNQPKNKYNITSRRVFTHFKEPILLGIARCKDGTILSITLLIYPTRSFSLSKGAALFQSSDTNESKVCRKVKKKITEESQK